MKTKLFLAAALGFMILGCVPSLHKLYTLDVEVFKEELLGTWVEDDNTWDFQIMQRPKSKDSKFFYFLQITDKKDQTAKFDAHLVDLDDKLFLDLYPKDEPKDANSWYKFHILPVHTFLRVELKGGQLALQVMNPETINELVEDKPDVVKYEVIQGSRLVLTAPTLKLQQFLIDYADYDDFFAEPGQLKRFVPTDPNDIKG